MQPVLSVVYRAISFYTLITSTNTGASIIQTFIKDNKQSWET